MSEENPKTKIEIRLEFRQLVVLGLTTMVGSGVLFGLGYQLGTAYGLLAQPTTSVQESRLTGTQTGAVKPSNLPIAEGQSVRTGSVSQRTRSGLTQSVITMKPTPKEVDPVPTTPSITMKPSPKEVDPVPTTPSIRVLPKLKRRVAETRGDVQPGLRPKLPDWPVAKARVSTSPLGKKTVNVVSGDARAHERRGETFAMVARNMNEPNVPEGNDAQVVKNVPEVITKSALDKSDASINLIEVATKTSAMKPSVSEELVTPPPSQQEVRNSLAVTQKQVVESKYLNSSPSSNGVQTENNVTNDLKKSSTSPNLNALKPVPAPSLSIYGAEHFTVQLKSIPSRKAAEDFSKKLIAKGYTPDIVLADIPKVGLYYRIRVGKFRRLGDAQRLQRSLSSHGLTRESPIITRY